MAAGILALIAVIVGYSSYVFVTMDSNVPGAPPGAGKLGDEHVHSSLLVRIFGDKFDFAVPSYQIKSSWIHFEDSDGSPSRLVNDLFYTREINQVDESFLTYIEDLDIVHSDYCYV